MAKILTIIYLSPRCNVWCILYKATPIGSHQSCHTTFSKVATKAASAFIDHWTLSTCNACSSPVNNECMAFEGMYHIVKPLRAQIIIRHGIWSKGSQQSGLCHNPSFFFLKWLWLVMLWFGPEPKFKPEPWWTWPKSGSKFKNCLNRTWNQVLQCNITWTVTK